MDTWVFADFSLPSRERIDMFRDLGFSHVVLGISSDRKRFKLNCSKQKLEDTIKWIQDDEKMDAHLMAWAIRDPDFMDEFITFDKWETIAVGAPILNAEGTFHKGKKNLLEPTCDAVREWTAGVGIGVVGLGDLHPSVKMLAEACTFIMPEAYSFWNSKKGHWSQSASTFPGPQQARNCLSWGDVKKPMIMSLACYMGKRPKVGRLVPTISDIQSMRYALAETLALRAEYDIQGVAYWSGKHLDGTSEEKQKRREFISRVSALDEEIDFP